jgi:site-specific DNA-cytosine methylase
VAVGTAHRLDGTVEAEIEKALENRTKRLSRLGNSVVPQCAQWLGRRLLEFDASMNP